MPRRDRVWLPLTLLTLAFIAFAVAMFLLSGPPLTFQGIPGIPGLPQLPDVHSATASRSEDFTALAPDLPEPRPLPSQGRG
jgi:hypothetical protein